jgi:hypothetical protein
MLLVVVVSAGFAAFAIFAAPSAETPAQPLRDARRLRTGTFTYRDVDRGKEVGSGSITIRQLKPSGNYQFVADTVFSEEFSGFRTQRWEAVAKPDFEPVSATLAFGGKSGKTPVFDLTYRPGRATGFAVDRKASPAGTKRDIDAILPPDIVDQRIDWAAILATKLEAGSSFEFPVYDPGSGVSRIIGRVAGPEQVQVPTGTFQAIRIIYEMQKPAATEHYEMLATKDSPRLMLREQFPNGVIAELTRISNDLVKP